MSYRYIHRKKPSHGTFSRYSSRKFNCRCARCRKAGSAFMHNRRLTIPGVREMERASSKKRHRKVTDYMRSLKIGRPCADCKNSFPPECMDFDHVRGEKIHEVSRVCNKEFVDAEILKCDLVCANCHRIRTKKKLARSGSIVGE